MVVIGAGPAGLNVARLLRTHHHIDPLIIERSNDHGPPHERWRIHRSDDRSTRLLVELGVEITTEEGGGGGEDAPVSTEPIRGLSAWDMRALQLRNPLSADHADLKSGCANLSDGAAMPAVAKRELSFAANDFLQQMTRDACIFYSSRVVDVRRRELDYVIQCRCRDQDGTFVNRTYAATILFICVPPHQAERWTIVHQWARAQIYAVQSVPMFRIRCRTPAPMRHWTQSASLIGVGAVHADDTEHFYASTTFGRLARFWQRLRLVSPSTFLSVCADEVRRTFRVLVDTTQITSRYDEHATHTWRPNPFLCLTHAVSNAVTPNPRHLPNVYWCAGAFSSHQGRLEGALETSELGVDAFTRASPALPRRPPSSTELSIEGRVLDVEAWCERHPGGRRALLDMVGKDATDDFYHVSHGPTAWSTVFALQVAFDQ